MSGATAAPDAVKAFRAMQVVLQSRLLWLTLFSPTRGWSASRQVAFFEIRKPVCNVPTVQFKDF
jgi:hypothetical protein